MKTAITILMAMALSVAAMVPASAQPAPSVRPSGHSPSAGPWIVGGIALGALSVIARAKVVGDREHRELTSIEATQAIFLPFFWVFSEATTPTIPRLPASKFDMPEYKGKIKKDYTIQAKPKGTTTPASDRR